MTFKHRLYASLSAAYMLAFPTEAFARHIEAGQVTTIDTNVSAVFTSVAFQEPFDVVPIVVSTPSTEGTSPADLRIRNVTTTGFEVAAIEPPGEDGPHNSMTIDYIAIEPGVTTLPNGTVIAAGFHSTSSTSTGTGTDGPDTFDTVPFGVTLSAAPGVVANIQTTNNEDNAIPREFSQPFMSIGAQLSTTTSVQLTLDRSETTNFGTVSVDETIGWIAFPNGSTGTLTDTSGAEIGWDARITPDNITGNCVSNTFSAISWPNARVVGTKEGRDGSDGGWLRRCSITNTTVAFEIEEDMTLNDEQNHTSENASILSFSDSFHAILVGELTGSKDVEMVTASEYSIPGNEIRYRLSAQSIGNTAVDSGSVVFIDALPDATALKVSDIDGPGSGPVRFINGTPNSGLSYNFISLSSTTDDVDFSNDGGSTFTYEPVPNGVGADSAVTHIRITPKGSFLAAIGGGSAPNFSAQFDAVIQ